MARAEAEQQVLLQFGRRLRMLREQRGLSQEALAAVAGLHRTYVGSAERGERNVALLAIDRMARGLGAHPADLLRD